MNADLVLEVVEQVLLSRQLSPIERVILCQSWHGKGYGEMAHESGYGSNYFKEIGSQLWHDLSEAIGQRVTKKNLHLVLTQYQAIQKPHHQEAQNKVRTNNLKNIEVFDNNIHDSNFAAQPEIEYPGGPVPLNSPLYINRLRIEELAYKEISKPGCLIRIKAPRKMGKSSLLNRMIECAQTSGYKTAYIDFQETEESVFTSLDKFLRWFSANVSRQLNLNSKLDDYWDEDMGSKVSCKIYFEEYLLEEIESPLVLALNEVNWIFAHPQLANDFLSMLRFWHEMARAVETWQKLRLVIVHSTEIHIPLKLNQSPFNVGLSIKLPEFTIEEVQDLAFRYGLAWTHSSQAQLLMEMVGGHPYLVNLALYHLHRHEMTLQELLQTASSATGIYSEHLRNHLAILREKPELSSVLLEVVTANESVEIDALAAHELESMGLIQLDGNQAMPSCHLYRLYFRQQLANDNDNQPQQLATEKQSQLVNRIDESIQNVSRHYIQQYLENHWQQWNKESLLLSIIVGEVDYFKWYNDAHGSVAGDAALQKITNTVRECVKQKTAVVVRFGGTKFAVILPQTNTDTVLKISENIRQSVKALAIPYNLYGVDGLPAQVLTVSIGVATTTPNPQKSPDMLLATVEEALLQAKRQGRDRVAVSAAFNEGVLLTHKLLRFRGF